MPTLMNSKSRLMMQQQERKASIALQSKLFRVEGVRTEDAQTFDGQTKWTYVHVDHFTKTELREFIRLTLGLDFCRVRVLRDGQVIIDFAPKKGVATN